MDQVRRPVGVMNATLIRRLGSWATGGQSDAVSTTGTASSSRNNKEMSWPAPVNQRQRASLTLSAVLLQGSFNGSRCGSRSPKAMPCDPQTAWMYFYHRWMAFSSIVHRLRTEQRSAGQWEAFATGGSPPFQTIWHKGYAPPCTSSSPRACRGVRRPKTDRMGMFGVRCRIADL
ncbi:hypothetical protein BDZ85DRAFT_29544 [Elsinoe ampelina]|uniref:Uncharacterized protein n=1 Tax=Elsinoe ampelina TaxID=302913 RepID=A0A6A6G4W7_9PEZI|nr:hypothetical protein BDZ85DRAFT_29544 [Elsinoe ampelina]